MGRELSTAQQPVRLSGTSSGMGTGDQHVGKIQTSAYSPHLEGS